MQILNVKTHSELAPTPQPAVLEEHSAERGSRFDEALDSEQERRNFDEQRHNSAAKIADKSGNDENDSSVPVTPEEDAKRLAGTEAKSDDNQENDWHDFLQSLYSNRESKEGKETSGKEVVSSKNVMKTEEAEMTLTLIDKLGISITEDEKQQLLEGGVLSEHLLKEIQELLNSGPISADAQALYEQLSELISGNDSVAAVEVDIDIDVDIVVEIPDQAELDTALEELVQGNPEALKNWLAEQNLPPKLMASLTDLVNEAATTLASLTKEELTAGVQDEIKTVLGETLSAITMLSRDVKSAEGNMSELVKGSLQDDNSKLLQTVEQLVQRLRTHNASESTAVATQVTVGQAQQPQENKVLAAFSSAAQEVRTLLQESNREDMQMRADSREFQLPRGMEQLITAQGLNEPAKNITSNFAAVTAQTTAQQSNINQLAARAMPTANQPMDTPFEQARQNQQYIDLFGPQAPTQLKEQIAVMFNNRNQFAEMRLDPPELGRLNIRLQMNGEQQASVTFHVTSPQAREAIEFAMPRLREMLEEQGIQLTDSSVREEASQLAQENQQKNGRGNQGGDHSDDGDAGYAEQEQMSTTTMDVPDGRIDYYV